MKKFGSVLGVLFTLWGGFAYAEESSVPHLMNLQSLIYDADGNLTMNESVDLTVRILDDENNVLYSETHPEIPVVNGAVNVSVGDQQALGLDILDPSSGQKVIDIAVDGENPFEVMPLVAVPYALWAQKALTVPDESITSQQIKNESIKLEDLEGGISFADLQGQASENQIPASVSTDTELNAHIDSMRAHSASSIVINSNFSNFVASNALEALQKIDTKLAEEIVNRQTAQQSIFTGYLRLDGTNAMSGDLNVGTRNITNVNQVDGVDVSDLNTVVRGGHSTSHANRINDHEIRIETLEGGNTNFPEITGQVSEAQVPQFMRPVSYGTIEVGSCTFGGMGGMAGHTVRGFLNGYNASVSPGGPLAGSFLRVNFNNAVSLPYTVVFSSITTEGTGVGEREANGFDIFLGGLGSNLCGRTLDFVVFKN